MGQEFSRRVYSQTPQRNSPSNSRYELEWLNEDIFIKILSYLTIQDKKNLRLSSIELKERIEDNCKELLIFTSRPGDVNLGRINKRAAAIRLKFHQEQSESVLRSLYQVTASKLLSIDLVGCELDENALLESGLKFANLQELSLEFSIQVTNTGLEALLLQLPRHKLTRLKIKDIQFTQQASLCLPGLRFPNLQVLEVENVWKLSEPGLCELLQLPGDKLRHLAIGVNGLTGEHLASLQLIFPNLKHLSIDFGKKMGENGLRSLLQMPGALLNFVYFGLIKFSQFDLNWLARLKFPRLESMVIENCRHLDRSRLLELVSLGGNGLKRIELIGTYEFSIRQEDADLLRVCPQVKLVCRPSNGTSPDPASVAEG